MGSTCEEGGKQGGIVLLRLSCLSIVENWEVVVVAGKEGRRLALDRMRETYKGLSNFINKLNGLLNHVNKLDGPRCLDRDLWPSDCEC